MELKDVYLWLRNIEGFTDNIVSIIEDNGVSIKELFYLSDKDIYNLQNINSNIKQNIVKYKSIANLETIKKELEGKSIKYICIKDKEYPNNLKHIHNPPNILFYKGDISILNKDIGLAMVGARKCTEYGMYCAKTISKQLSDLGVNIISGLAIGIDYYSHLGCLSGKSKTIAVLPSSVDNPLPKQNLKITEKILENGGLLLSQYLPKERVYTSNFCLRNRVISGISDGVIVVEAGEKSGALITVDYALEQGKNIFAIPGRINSYMSKGCHKIIKDGAKLIENIEDILSEYQISSIKNKENHIQYDNFELNEDYIKIIEEVKCKGVLHIDEICANTRMEIKKLNSILNELVLKDLLIELRNKTYSLNI